MKLNKLKKFKLKKFKLKKRKKRKKKTQKKRFRLVARKEGRLARTKDYTATIYFLIGIITLSIMIFVYLDII